MYYTGITTELQRRVAEHNRGKGCAFTARRLPVRLVYSERRPNKSEARKRELKIKPLSRPNKERLIREQARGFPSITSSG